MDDTKVMEAPLKNINEEMLAAALCDLDYESLYPGLGITLSLQGKLLQLRYSSDYSLQVYDEEAHKAIDVVKRLKRLQILHCQNSKFALMKDVGAMQKIFVDPQKKEVLFLPIGAKKFIFSKLLINRFKNFWLQQVAKPPAVYRPIILEPACFFHGLKCSFFREDLKGACELCLSRDYRRLPDGQLKARLLNQLNQFSSADLVIIKQYIKMQSYFSRQ